MSSTFSEKFCFKTFSGKVLRKTPGVNLWPSHGHRIMYTQKDTLNFITSTLGIKQKQCGREVVMCFLYEILNWERENHRLELLRWTVRMNLLYVAS